MASRRRARASRSPVGPRTDFGEAQPGEAPARAGGNRADERRGARCLAGTSPSAKEAAGKGETLFLFRARSRRARGDGQVDGGRGEMTTPRWNDPKAVQAAIQRNREIRGTDPLWWRHGLEEVSEPTETGDRDKPGGGNKPAGRRTGMKQYLLVGLILICAWVVASLGIRIFGILVLGMRNSEISVGVVSALAVVAVAVWIWRDDLF
jgi:hypothetical protein